ncbi:OTOG protein, partial [Atractosteus spatula]|nr:OTOG protein [Atractosteus spatula]
MSFPEPCTFPCLNGGECVHPESCNCSQYEATGVRCQTVPNKGFERELICRTWGQYNYETFDGLYYYFPGKCTYTLVRECDDAVQPSFMIQVHNDPTCHSSTYQCARSVSLFLPGDGELRLQKYNITFRGQSIQLPHSMHDVEIERISQYILVTQQHGFTLAWDGSKASVYLKMSPEYVGRTCGLCGNFNADVQDDLKTSFGLLTHDVALFGNSWMETEPLQQMCSTVPADYTSPCSSHDRRAQQNVHEWCGLLLKPPFKYCHEFVSPFPFMASCFNDLCITGPNANDEVLCQTLAEYARACAHSDHPLHDWRAQIPQCAVECDDKFVYRECITCCPVSCSIDKMCIDSKLQCLDGCYCPEDLIYDNGSCVQPSECPCDYHGMVFSPGHIVQEECNNCTCVGGYWNCTDHRCPGECSVTGDIHFQTLDGQVYTFQATCQYVLAKSRTSGKFTVTIQNAPCGVNLDGACIQSVSLVVDEDPRKEITVTHNGEVYVFSQYRIALPYTDASYAVEKCEILNQELFSRCHEYLSPVPFHQQCKSDTCKCGKMCLCGVLAHYARQCRKYGVIIDFRAHISECNTFLIQELSSMFIQIKTMDGLRLQYNWKEARLYLQLDEVWKEDTIGLCGTFNGNILDDFLSPAGMIESTPQLFGNSWKLSSACVPGHSIPQLDPCDIHQQAASYAVEKCEILNQELFSRCHEYLSPVPFHQQCKSDTCKCGKMCLCGVLAHYARQCRKYGVIIDFRAHISECTVQCPETMVYGPCVSSCPQRCPSLVTPEHCGEECEEGCACPPGTYYSSKALRCVQKNECSCNFLGVEYAPGDIIMTSSGMQVCKDGRMISQSSSTEQSCPSGQLYVGCSDSLDGTALSEGIVCEQTSSYAVEKCEILNQELFSRCHEYLSPVPFHQQCKSDTCKCGKMCLCGVLAHYARQCRKYGVIIDFRAHISECREFALFAGMVKLSLTSQAVQCPETMVYGPCVSSCPQRCPSLVTPEHCGEECEEGCACPPGTYYSSKALRCVQKLLKHGDECFEPAACPCLWKGKEYYPGDKVMSPCHSCVCQHGSFQCDFHPCPSMCTAYGDRHYRTFDGLLFDYVGACKVYLLKSSIDLTMSITAENVDCYDSGVICRKSLLINLGKSFIVFDNDSGKPNPSSLIDKHQNVFIWQAGYFTILHAPDEDITVLWDRRTTIHIQAGPRWQGKLSGLCGNFDMKTVNEMRTPENIDSATPQEFGNSWTAAECVNSPDIRHPCSLSPLREPFAKRECGILLSEVFQVCHHVVDVTWFYMNCLTDTCSCNRGGDSYDCEFYNKVLGKGPFMLVTYKERDTVLAANLSGGPVFPEKGVTTVPGLTRYFMMTPGLSRARPHGYSKFIKKNAHSCTVYTVLYIIGQNSKFSTLRHAQACHELPSMLNIRTGLTLSCHWQSLDTAVTSDTIPLSVAMLLSTSSFIPNTNVTENVRDTSLVSFEAAERPNYFLRLDPSGHLDLTKWEESDRFQDETTFVIHRNTWISGYDSLESYIKPGFFLHYMLSWFHLMKYNHSAGFREATLFKLTESEYGASSHSPCQWRYESCASACFKTCSDPTGQTCASIPKVEGCLPQCPHDMVLDEVTQRCVHVVDCIKPTVAIEPITPYSTVSPPAAVTSASINATGSPGSSLSTAHSVSHTDTLTQLSTAETKSTLRTPGITSQTALPSATATTLNFTGHEAELTSSSAVFNLTTTTTELSVSTAGPAVLESVTTEKTSETSTMRLISTSVFKTRPSSLYTKSTERTSTESTMAPFWLSTTSTAPATSKRTTASFTALTDSKLPSTVAWSSGPKETISLPTTLSLPSKATDLTLATSKMTVPPMYTTTTTQADTSNVTEATTVTTGPMTMSNETTTRLVEVTSSPHATQPKTPESTVHSSPAETVKTTEASTPEVKSPITPGTTSLSPETDTKLTSSRETTSVFFTAPGASTKTTAHPLADLTTSATAKISTPKLEVLTKENKIDTTSQTSVFPPSSIEVTHTTLQPIKTAMTFTPLTTTTTETKAPLILTTTQKAPTTPFTSQRTTVQLFGKSTTSRFSKTTSTLVGTPSVVVSSATSTVSTSPSVSSLSQVAPSTAGRTTVSTEKMPTMAGATKTTFPTQRSTLGTTLAETTQFSMSTGALQETSKSSSIAPLSWATATTALRSSAITTAVSTPAQPTEQSTQATTPTQTLTTVTSSEPSHPSAVVTPKSTEQPLVLVTSESQTTQQAVSTSISKSTEALMTEKTSAVVNLTATAESLKTTSYAHLLTSKGFLGQTTASIIASTSKLSLTSTAPSTNRTEYWSTQTREPGTTTEDTGTPSVLPQTTDHTTVAVSTKMCTPPYSEIIDECTKYVCMNGQLMLFNKSQNCPNNAIPPNCGLLGFAVLVNGDKCCPQWDCPCRCSVFPDLNVITFDGNSVAIYKAASYIVTQLPNETVSIQVQECQSSDTVLWNFTNLCLVALNITHKSHQVLINRLQRRLYVNSRYARPRFKKHGFEVLDTGNMYLIRTPTGLKIQWFHSTGMMIIETETSSNKLNTMGLCGCCDGDPTNDLTMSNGTAVAESEDPTLFIDSWQVPNTTSFMGQNRRREVNCSTSDCSACLTMLSNHTFSVCHSFVPPSVFCEVWVRDAEYVKSPCIALAAYVAACHKYNICIEWRSPDYCSFMCPPELRYQACLPACTAQTCPSHESDSDPEECSGLTEGCVCPDETVLHRPYSALCIPSEKCACTDSFGTPRASGEVWKASKDGCCMYKCDNDSIIPVEYNCTDIPGPVCRKTGEVVVSLADDKSCCPQKACVCNHTLCSHDTPGCKYGERLVSYYREDSCCPEYTCECDPDRCESDIPTCREDQTLIATRADGSCCMAYICMCGTCSDTIPACQQGEVFTVDANSTDRCCPEYQCMCEPYRCPAFTCPLGMSVVTVWTPERCCPLNTCECACDTIPKPKCALGETMQIDTQFLADPENQCGCTKYKCERESVCVDGERGVMRPGQTLVEHTSEGICYTTQCTYSLDPLTQYYRIRASSTNCSAQCQPNQVYLPPKDLTTCCGVCKNISCIYHMDNGSVALFKPGKTWVSNCMKYDCSDTLSGPTLITYSISCPPFNETECMKIGGTVVSYMDGCCKSCKEDGKSCQKVTVRMTIRKNDCRSNRPVNIVSCDGKCPSASIYNYNINTYARFCKCCREIGLQRRSVQLYCSGNSTWVYYSIQEPTDCSCQWS